MVQGQKTSAPGNAREMGQRGDAGRQTWMWHAKLASHGHCFLLLVVTNAGGLPTLTPSMYIFSFLDPMPPSFNSFSLHLIKFLKIPTAPARRKILGRPTRILQAPLPYRTIRIQDRRMSLQDNCKDKIGNDPMKFAHNSLVRWHVIQVQYLESHCCAYSAAWTMQS